MPFLARAARRASAARAAGSVSPSPSGPADGSRSGGPLLLELLELLLELLPELPESFSGPLPGAFEESSPGNGNFDAEGAPEAGCAA
jgi:hypothetical protein